MIIFLLAVGCNVCQQLDFKSNGAVTLKSMCCTAAAAASDLHRADLRGNELVQAHEFCASTSVQQCRCGLTAQQVHCHPSPHPQAPLLQVGVLVPTVPRVVTVACLRCLW